ncbi:DNA adenine methylase [Streptomonospora salina]|uniref:site-specific DNA-methyltransferase (adenine-specific) n=2 Tax=Streptomonospora salina TaxID=104205 RepID=A0A841E6Q1_9ACTN|nr:DNA adenine methylase [Streptomonospora salina]
MAPIFQSIISEQRPRPTVYVEPYAGGAGAALSLLFNEVVDHVVLNDLNRGIAQFWRSVFHDTEEFVDLVLATKPTVEEWFRQREVYQDPDSRGIGLAFATFFLNRTNRSGIFDAGPIGGMDQSGRWKIDARYNPTGLAKRLIKVGSYRHRVEVREEEGVQVVEKFTERSLDTFSYIDPPYLGQGDRLYLNTLSWEDHVRLAKALTRNPAYWLLTYDKDDRVHEELYPDNPCALFGISHTAGPQHVGSEYLISSQGLYISGFKGVGERSAFWLEGREPTRSH